MRFYRHPKTLAARKVAAAAKAESNFYNSLPIRTIRAKRGVVALPGDWEDLPHTTQRSWKAQRRSQYRL